VRVLSGPLLATETGGRMRQNHLWELVRRLAKVAGLEMWDQLSPHSLRHTAITLAQMGRIAFDASFGGLCERRRPGVRGHGRHGLQDVVIARHAS
jgi:integrase